MTDYTKLFSAISTLYAQHREPVFINKMTMEFPFDQMYPGQRDVLLDLKGFKEAAITTHTGGGKTPVFLAATRGEPTVVIEPRKFLQKQVKEYYHDYILFGRSEYPCKHAFNAAIAPCQSRLKCEATDCHNYCPEATQTCLNKQCDVFAVGTAYVKYPCGGCVYMQAVKDAIGVLKRGGTIICNFGNFWNLLPFAKIVVIDEADLFFREISSPTRIRYSDGKKNADDEIAQLLDRESKGLTKALETTTSPRQSYDIQNMKRTIDFLKLHSALCFKYQKKDKIYVEVSPDNVSVLKDKIFKGKRLLIVSATLGDFNIPQYSYSVWQRRGIFFNPVGKMTSRNIAMTIDKKTNRSWLLDNAATAIKEISGIAEVKYDTRQFVVHCGNIGTHATALNELLGKDECVLHEAGSLMKTIDTFTASDKRYLLVASAEYGADFAWCKLQFVLKFPYASLDERMRVLERVMGKDKFNRFYLNDAITRFVQQCGRNVRGYGDFGVTVVLDSKFIEVYRANENCFPDWFREGFDGKVY